MSCLIRRATSADAPELADLAARTFRETFAHTCSPNDMALHLSTHYSPALQGAEIADAAVDVLLALSDGRLAGFAQLRVGEVAPPCVRAETPAELWRFYVDQPWHGRGVAAVLMAAAVEAAHLRRADTLWLSVWEGNQRARSFYARHGFGPAGTQAFVVGTDVQNDWILVRSLLPGVSAAS